MAEGWQTENLPRANRDIAPAVYDEEKERWVVILGRDGRMFVRDDSVERELKTQRKMENFGTSSDPKPDNDDVPTGAVFFEIDTETVYINDGEDWKEMD